MNLFEIRAQLEAEQTHRLDELRFFKNQLSNMSSDIDMCKYRRSLVLMLYSYFEGYFKFALELYVDEINKSGLKRADVNYKIATASMFKVFEALKDPNKKCAEFKQGLPNDTKLHTHARSIEFLENFSNLLQEPLEIPTDIVDAESNLKPIIIKKNLFRLGFNHDLYDDISNNVDRLLKYRNNISHGTTKDGLTSRQYDPLEEAALYIIKSIKMHVYNALKSKNYMKN